MNAPDVYVNVWIEPFDWLETHRVGLIIRVTPVELAIYCTSGLLRFSAGESRPRAVFTQTHKSKSCSLNTLRVITTSNVVNSLKTQPAMSFQAF